jgi:hypothetical protein
VWASTDVEADEIGDRIDDILHWERDDENGIKSVLVLKDIGKRDSQAKMYGLNITVRVKVVK